MLSSAVLHCCSVCMARATSVRSMHCTMLLYAWQVRIDAQHWMLVVPRLQVKGGGAQGAASAAIHRDIRQATANLCAPTAVACLGSLCNLASQEELAAQVPGTGVLAGTLAVASCMQVGMPAGGLLLASCWQPLGGCICQLHAGGQACQGPLVGTWLAATWWCSCMQMRGLSGASCWHPHGGCSCTAPVWLRHAEGGVLAVGHLLVELHKLQPKLALTTMFLDTT